MARDRADAEGDRILSGILSGGARGGDRLEELLTQARAEALHDPRDVPPGILAAMVAAVGSDAPVEAAGQVRPRRRLVARIAAFGAATAVFLTGGLAAAGALPDPAQRLAADVLSHVGVSVPRPGDQPPGATGIDRQPATVPTDDAALPAAAEHGVEVSEAAHSDTTGPGKGTEVSDVARDGHGADRPAGPPLTPTPTPAIPARPPEAPGRAEDHVPPTTAGSHPEPEHPSAPSGPASAPPASQR